MSRHDCRLRIAAALALAGLLGAGAAVHAQPGVGEPEREERAVQAVLDLGGRADRNEYAPGRPVTGVTFREPIKDQDLELLAAFPRLESLTLANAGITDAGLARLAGLTQLKTLSISDVPITDAGLRHLAGLTRLESLEISKVNLTDAGLAHLKGLTRLESLTLSDARVTGPGLANLKGLTRLRDLRLSNLPVTDAGLAHLKGPVRLEWLVLSGLPITETGLTHLRGLQAVRRLRLSDVKLTGAEIARVKEALPYTLVHGGSGEQGHSEEETAPGNRLLKAGTLAALGLAAALLLLTRPWQPEPRGRRWLWKLPLVAAPLFVVGDELQQVASWEAPLRDGDAATFWLHACGIDVGLKNVEFGRGFYQPREGWFIYYKQGFHTQFLYRVKAEDALVLVPRVVQRLQNAPPGALDSEVEKAYEEWGRADPKRADATVLLAKLREAELAWLRQQDRQLYEYALACEQAFGERWERVKRYGWTVAFEFVFLAGLILFAAWPWLRAGGPLRWAVHVGFVPLLFCLPYWLGYAPLAFTSAPSGGVLYPHLLFRFRGLPWTALDTTIVRNLPRPLEPLSQTPGPMLSMTQFGGVGPVAVATRSALLAAVVFVAGLVIRRVRQLQGSPGSKAAQGTSGEPSG